MLTQNLNTSSVAHAETAASHEVEIYHPTAKVVVSQRELDNAVFCLVIVIALVAFTNAWQIMFNVLVVGMVLATFATIFIKVVAMSASKAGKGRVHPSEEKVEEVLESGNLPSFTIALPMYGEDDPSLIVQLVQAMHFQYDLSRVDVRIVTVEGDTVSATSIQQATVEMGELPSHVRWQVVPRPTTVGLPQTKPAQLRLAVQADEPTTDWFVIFDCEDRPHPLTLAYIAAAAQQNPEVSAFQAELRYYDAELLARGEVDPIANENLSTRFAAISYKIHFQWMMAGFAWLGIMPFGGTAIATRVKEFRSIGWMDPWCIVEDALAGQAWRLNGFQAAYLDGVPNVERPNAGSFWDKVVTQWTRWQGGFLVTAIVHARNWRQVLPRLLNQPTTALWLLVQGLTPLYGAMTPLALALSAVYLIAGFTPGGESVRFAIQEAFAPVVTLAWFNTIVGLGLSVATYWVAGRQLGFRRIHVLEVIVKAYAFMVVTGIRGINRALFYPHTWGKTPRKV